MNIERDKFLTEVMGECCHEFDLEWDTRSDSYKFTCRHCISIYWGAEDQFDDGPINFSTWEGFGKLWEWSQKQEWWADFQYENYQNAYCHFDDHILTTDIHPDRFADAVYKFLKERR